MAPLTTEQLEMRRTGIGASEVAAVCGISPWQSPIDVWLRKVGATGEEEPNEAMQAGNFLERGILDWYAHEMGGIALETGLPTLRHPKHEFAFATPDGRWKDGSRLVQVKNVGLRMTAHWGEDPESIPEDYRAQIEWEMEVTGVSRCDVAVCIGGQKLRIYPIERDPELAASLVVIVGAFWRNHVLAEVPPPIDASDSARRYLEKRHPSHVKPLAVAPPEAEEWAHRYAAALALEKQADDEKRLAGNKLREMIGEAEGVAGPWGKATWKQNGKAAPAWKQIAEELGATPEIIARHTPPGGRVLRVYPKKNSST